MVSAAALIPRKARVNNSTRQSVPPDLLRDRYGVHPARRPGPLAAIAVVAAVALVAWLGWAVWHNSSGTMGAEVHSFEVTSAHSVSVTVDLHHLDGKSMYCTIQAFADDHTVVGQTDLHVAADEPIDTTKVVDIKTERLATTATVSGCG